MDRGRLERDAWLIVVWAWLAVEVVGRLLGKRLF